MENHYSEDNGAERGEKRQSGSSPSHIAYQVREGKDGQGYFNRIGAAFAHKDKQGFDLRLDSVPVDGRVTLRTLKDRLDQQRGGTERAHRKRGGKGAEPNNLERGA